MRYHFFYSWKRAAFFAATSLLVVLAQIMFAASATDSPPEGPDPITVLARRVDSLKPESNNIHDKYVLVCVREAFEALKEGNYGVGACLVDKNGDIIIRGHNHVYTPYHRGDLHAEMSVLLAAEELERTTDTSRRKSQTLYTSVEPCVMCFARVIGSGVQACYYASDDGPSGMVHFRDNLPPSYKPRLKDRIFERCQCSKSLSDVAVDIYSLSFTRLGKK